MSKPNWLEAAAFSDVPQDDVIGVEVAGRDIALYNVEGEVYATDNICTHGNARLCDGFLDGHEIECPMHQGKFDVRNGHTTCSPVTESLRSYPVKIEAGRVYLAIDLESPQPSLLPLP